MSHVAHSLHDEFPGDIELLHRLKLSGDHFHALSESYQAVNRAIYRIENGLEPASDQRLEELKKQRLALLDEVSVILDRARA